MADTATASVLMTDVRRLTDTENDAHIADAYLLTLIDRSYNKLYRAIATQYESFFDTEDTSKSLVINQRDYALAADLMHLKGVDIVIGGERVTMRPYGFGERNDRSNDPRIYRVGYDRQSTSYRYRTQANNLRIDPVPNSTEQLIMTYVPRPTRITTSGQTFDVLSGFDDFIIYDASVQVLMRQERDPSAMAALRQDALQAVIAAVSPRDIGDPTQVRDAYFGSNRLRW
jgi:hypothetical protein